MTLAKTRVACACGMGFIPLFKGQPCPFCQVEVVTLDGPLSPSVKVMTRETPQRVGRPAAVRQPDHTCGFKDCSVMVPANRTYCSRSCKGRDRKGTHYAPRMTVRYARVTHPCAHCGTPVPVTKVHCNHVCAANGIHQNHGIHKGLANNTYESVEARRTRAYLRAIEHVFALKEAHAHGQ